MKSVATPSISGDFQSRSVASADGNDGAVRCVVKMKCDQSVFREELHHRLSRISSSLGQRKQRCHVIEYFRTLEFRASRNESSRGPKYRDLKSGKPTRRNAAAHYTQLGSMSNMMLALHSGSSRLWDSTCATSGRFQSSREVSGQFSRLRRM